MSETEYYKGYKIIWETDDDTESPRDWNNLGIMCCWHRRHTLGDRQPEESAGDHIRDLIKPKTWNAELARRQAEIRANGPFSNAFTADDEKDAAEQEIEDKVDAVEGDMQEDSALCWKLFERDHVVLPLYLYDHSGITMSTTPFGCKWDSGQVGFIYTTLTDCKRYLGGERVPEGTNWDTVIEDWDEKKTPIKLRDMAARILRGEVQTYDDFITSNVRHYRVETPTEDEDDEGEEIWSCGGFYPSRDENGRESWDFVLDEARGEIDAHIKETEEEAAMGQASVLTANSDD